MVRHGGILLLSPPSSPPPFFLVVGLGAQPTRPCHVCHPPGTHEHLSKIPGGRGRAVAAASAPPPPWEPVPDEREQETKVVFSSSSWAGSRVFPQRHLLLAALTPGARVAKAQARTYGLMDARTHEAHGPVRQRPVPGHGLLAGRSPLT